MQVKFYYSFKGFLANYESDFSHYLAKYPNATELNFIDEIAIIYDRLLLNGQFKNEIHALTSMDYFQIENDMEAIETIKEKTIEDPVILSFGAVADLVANHLRNIDCKDFKEYYCENFMRRKNMVENCETYELSWTYFNNIANDYCPWIKYGNSYSEISFALRDLELLFPLLKFSEEIGIELDYYKFKDFTFSIERIWNYLINRETFLLDNDEFTELNLRQGDQENKHLTNPQKIGILGELGLLKVMNDKGYTITQYQKLLSCLFDITERSVRNNNIGNMKHSKFIAEFLKDLKETPSVR